MAAYGPRYIAQGNITPSRFVKIASADFGVTQASAATDKVVGVSQPGTRQPPGVTGSDAYAAHSGETLHVYSDGEECLLEIGSGGCTRGDYLKSDANGKGVSMTFSETAVTWYGAIALETASAGEFARVLVKVGPVKPA